MTGGLGVPTTLDDVDAAWVEGALAAALPGVKVTDADVIPVTDGVGLVGQVGRIVPSYGVRPEGTPDELILKMPTSDPAIRGFAAGMGMYEREGRFYEDIAPHVEIQLPRVLHNVCDPAADRYCLLMEKLEIGHAISQRDGASPDEAADIIGAIGRLHAAWFDHPRLKEWSWLPRPSNPVNKSIAPRFAGAWPHFLEHYAARVPAETVSWVEQFSQRMDAWWDSKDQPPFTVVHGDFRLDNMVWTPDGDLVLLDWQIVQAGFGLYDVASFVVTNMSVDDRRRAEHDLLELWRDTMVASGADPGSRDDVWGLYREMVLFWTTGVTCATADFGGSPEGRSLVELLIDRAFTAADDLRVGDVIPD